MTFLRSAATLAGIGILLASNGVVSAESSFQRRQGKGPKRCYGIRVEPEDSPSGESRRRRDRPSFSTREVFDLSFEIRLSESAATQSLKLKIFTPNGSLYDILEAEASAGPPGKRTRSGRHRPSRRGARLARRGLSRRRESALRWAPRVRHRPVDEPRFNQHAAGAPPHPRAANIRERSATTRSEGRDPPPSSPDRTSAETTADTQAAGDDSRRH